ncbi:MAG: hypothetical protein WD577_08205 [Bacteroidales bacterium]
MLVEEQIESERPHPNGYKHTCLNCGKIFYGRKNRQYCSNACKIFLNNKKASERRDRISKQINTYSKNEDILHRNYRIWDTEIDIDYIRIMGFDFRGPYKVTKDEYDGAVWYQVGHYIYNTTRKKGKMIIRKLEETQHDNN